MTSKAARSRGMPRRKAAETRPSNSRLPLIIGGGIALVVIIAAIAALEFRFEDRIHRIGASAGATPVNRDSPEINELLHRADKACYAAKESGRNRLCIYARGDAGAPVSSLAPTRRPPLFH